jgi:hypothetical protein
VDSNPSIESALADLRNTHEALWDRFNITEEPDELAALHQEMIEVLHRMQIAQRLAFRKETAALARRAAEVQAATKDIRKQIKALKKVSEVIGQISKYLGVVDKLLDAAKMLP